MNRLNSSAFLALALLVAGPAHAHTVGAGGAGLAAGLAHPMAGLDHLLAMVGVGLWAALLGGRAVWVLPVAFPATMAAGAALAMTGVGMPSVETGVSLSVLALGLVIAMAWRPSLPLAAALVAGFAVLHGHAHGAELPDAASPVLYGLGFLIMTLVLHLAGIGLGSLAHRANGDAARGIATRLGGSAIAACGLLLVLGTLS